MKTRPKSIQMNPDCQALYRSQLCTYWYIYNFVELPRLGLGLVRNITLRYPVV